MNTQFLKSTAKFSDFALLKKEAENLANNGKLVHWNTLEESERDANPENSCRFSKAVSRESLTACNVGNYEVRPLFTLRAQNGKPEEGYICEFNWFQLWNTETNEAYCLNSDKTGKLYLWSPSIWAKRDGFNHTECEPNKFKKVTEKILNNWFEYLRGLDKAIKAYNEDADARTAKSMAALARHPHARKNGNRIEIEEGGIRYTYEPSNTSPNGVCRSVKICYNGLISTEEHLNY